MVSVQLNPVLQYQASNPGKFAAVIGNQGALLSERMGRNHGVQRSASSKGRMKRGLGTSPAPHDCGLSRF